jgi:uncharacterized membrane protein
MNGKDHFKKAEEIVTVGQHGWINLLTGAIHAILAVAAPLIEIAEMTKAELGKSDATKTQPE